MFLPAMFFDAFANHATQTFMTIKQTATLSRYPNVEFARSRAVAAHVQNAGCTRRILTRFPKSALGRFWAFDFNPLLAGKGTNCPRSTR